MTDIEHTARQLAEWLGSATGMGFGLPSHYAIRLAVLVGDEEVRFFDTDVDRNQARDWQVVVFGESLVIHMRVQVPADDVVGGERTVTTALWARGSLRGLQVPPVMDAENEPVWGYVPKDGWPRKATMELNYEGHPEPLVLPLPNSTAGYGHGRELGALMPTLLADLRRL